MGLKKENLGKKETEDGGKIRQQLELNKKGS